MGHVSIRPSRGCTVGGGGGGGRGNIYNTVLARLEDLSTGVPSMQNSAMLLVSSPRQSFFLLSIHWTFP